MQTNQPTSPAAQAVQQWQTAIAPGNTKARQTAMLAAMAYAANNRACPVVAKAVLATLLGRAPTAKQLAAATAYMAALPAAAVVGLCPPGTTTPKGAMPYAAHLAIAVPRTVLAGNLPKGLPLGAAKQTVPATGNGTVPKGKQAALLAQACSAVGLTPAISNAVYGNGWGAKAYAWAQGKVAAYGGTLAGGGTSAQLALPKGSPAVRALRNMQGNSTAQG